MRILILTSNMGLTGGKERFDKSVLRVLQELWQRVDLVQLKNTRAWAKITFIFEVFVRAVVFRPDAIFCYNVGFSPLCYFLNRCFGIKYIVFAYGVEVWQMKNRLEKKALLRATLIVSVSRYTAQKIMEQMPCMNERIVVAHPTIDSERFVIKEKPNYLKERHLLDNKTKIILTVTRLYTEERGIKGYYKVIEALPFIKKEIPDVQYILVGDGNDRENVGKFAERIGVGKNVLCTGFIPDTELVDYYNLCDVFIMPSKQEGFGIVFLEALACGKPVIVGNQDASKEAILDGKLGLLVNPDNVNEIAGAVVRVLQKNIPNQLLDRKFLRETMLNAYDYDAFKKRVTEIVRRLKLPFSTQN